MFIDIHTHSKSSVNLFGLRDGVHTLGIHPWKLILPFDKESLKNEFENLKRKYHQKIFAIGECGLDRRREGIANIDDQVEVLKWHLKWAESVSRPLIIHCVHAYSDLLQALKLKKFKGKILLHDFSGNEIEAKALLFYDCYFSFGKSLFNENKKSSSVFKAIPHNRLFLETDDQQEIDIVSIYKQASILLNLPISECEKLFEENLKDFFSNLNDISSADIINYLTMTSRS